ncbi:MAG: hypothetical protein K0R93_83 [Anaerosolibacter sp.]|nr:hypothetical protein [Anaerosolibacter sp.]
MRPAIMEQLLLAMKNSLYIIIKDRGKHECFPLSLYETQLEKWVCLNKFSVVSDSFKSAAISFPAASRRRR